MTPSDSDMRRAREVVDRLRQENEALRAHVEGITEALYRLEWSVNKQEGGVSIREEFENAWQKALYTEIPHSNNYEEEMRSNVLWAAKWMAEKIAPHTCDCSQDWIRQLAKELQ